jgi:hypothetical protein
MFRHSSHRGLRQPSSGRLHNSQRPRQRVSVRQRRGPVLSPVHAPHRNASRRSGQRRSSSPSVPTGRAGLRDSARAPRSGWLVHAGSDFTEGAVKSRYHCGRSLPVRGADADWWCCAAATAMPSVADGHAMTLSRSTKVFGVSAGEHDPEHVLVLVHHVPERAIAFGLKVLWAIIAMVVGTLLGMAFTVLHAVQGRASACRR